jgi:hypothetical protein
VLVDGFPERSRDQDAVKLHAIRVSTSVIDGVRDVRGCEDDYVNHDHD